ncbi:penicillin-binding transpeptidase domain-containing protein [Alkalihalobacterium chitinilyticum]|uniref:serine-type D-Ala-D-Ala carboxypeptidase n=1 Tax=Alkalihalobacterium chitinilyticum TaxID=2980103 RepID=A0ABT5V8R3_9BACI|nr:penicillin-binding transpeptidase domain-containing protein [Alkalihalobacterium chitinilyticum]MDE5411821.1 penicillin-binding transpeptidase domain-containing protein [Alkalihalobacterium chitinilyticum]
MSKQMKIRGIIALFVTLFLLAGCSEELPTPEDALSEFATHWEKRNYDLMYELLSIQAKNLISKEEFIETYTEIYSEIQAEDLVVTTPIRDPEDEITEDVTEALLQYEQELDTIAGKLQLEYAVDLQLEETDELKQWKINWTPAMIFPPLEQGDRVKVRTLTPIRGEIIDRNGDYLAKNGNAVQIGLVQGRMEGLEEYTISELSKQIDVSVEEIEAALDQSWVRPDTFVPVKTVPYDQMEFVEELRTISEGVTYLLVPAREYPLGEAAAHLIGYITPITKELLEKNEDKGYNSNSLIGRTGLESLYEDELRGENGAVISIVDKGGNEKDILAKKEAVDGKTLQLTIDGAVQVSIYEQYKKDNDAGTGVALHPTSGEVLALVNAPAYNPNEFVIGSVSETNYTEDERRPLLNRFTQAYAPGSTVKSVTAAIALEDGWDPDEKRKIDGLGWRKDDSWGNYEVRRVKDPNHDIDLTDALVYSDNIYIAQMALELNEKSVVDGLQSFGFEESVPFKYPLTTSQIANDGIKTEVQLADTAYGQAEMLVNPLHMSLMYTAFINEGNIPKPLLFTDEEPEIWKEDVISNDHANRILSDLSQVIQSPNGTASNAKIDGIPLAGKTGTTEYKLSQTEEGKEFGWFIAMNTNDPELLVLMMVEDVEGGSGYVVPKVKDVFLQNLR